MRKRRSIKIRNKVFDDLGYEPTLDDPKSKIIKDPDFKTIYRAAKKNYLRSKKIQQPKLRISKRQARLQNQSPINQHI